MPTYDYQCEKCQHEWEREQRITEDPIKTCPQCKSRKAKRLLSAPGFILKGGGWYADGYGSGGAKKPSSSDGGSGDDSDGGSSPSKSKSTDDSSGGSKTDSSSGDSPKSGTKASKSAA
jgi:putative FmdB family regulatory protein